MLRHSSLSKAFSKGGLAISFAAVGSGCGLGVGVAFCSCARRTVMLKLKTRMSRHNRPGRFERTMQSLLGLARVANLRSELKNWPQSVLNCVWS